MIAKSTCPICSAKLPIQYDVCRSCGTYTHRLPDKFTSKQAALFLELQAKWRPEGRFEDSKCKHSDYGICWSPDLRKFISVYGVRSQYNMDVANCCVDGRRLMPFDSPFYAKEVASAKLKYVGGVPSLYDEYQHITEISDWLSNASLSDLNEALLLFKKKSYSALPKLSDIALATVFTIGSIGLAYKTLGSNSNRDNAKETVQSIAKAIKYRFEGSV